MEKVLYSTRGLPAALGTYAQGVGGDNSVGYSFGLTPEKVAGELRALADAVEAGTIAVIGVSHSTASGNEDFERTTVAVEFTAARTVPPSA